MGAPLPVGEVGEAWRGSACGGRRGLVRTGRRRLVLVLCPGLVVGSLTLAD